MEYLTCDKLKDMRNIYICGFACMNILGNWPVVGLIRVSLVVTTVHNVVSVCLIFPLKFAFS